MEPCAAQRLADVSREKRPVLHYGTCLKKDLAHMLKCKRSRNCKDMECRYRKETCKKQNTKTEHWP